MTTTDRRAGFSLLEVMLAMVALALVSMICYGAFHLGIRAVEKGGSAVVMAQRLRIGSDLLTRQLKSAVSYPLITDDGDELPYFVGTPTEVSFVTTAGLSGGGGLAHVRYFIAPRGDGTEELYVEETTDFTPRSLAGGGTQPTQPPRKAMVLDGFRGLRFKFYSPNDEEDGPLERWEPGEQDTMPLAVQVMIEGLPGFETEAWASEMPLMPLTYGLENGDLDESLLADFDDDPFATGTGQNGDGDTSSTDSGDDAADTDADDVDVDDGMDE